MTKQDPYWTTTKAAMDNEKNLSVFKTWKTVRSIPIYKDNELPIPYSTEVEYMLSRRSPDEIERWKPCLKEPFLGHTKESYAAAQWKVFKDTPTTTWTLKSAHHILTYEALSGRSILRYDQIVEFGAGIGETARLIMDLGFRGDYYILVLPEIARISGFYVQGRAKITCKVARRFARTSLKYHGARIRLVIATWSLSEVPIEYRNDVVSFFKGSDFLMIFQNEIFEYKHYDYFSQVFPMVSGTSVRMHPIVWHNGAKGNWYLAARGLDKPTSTKCIDDIFAERSNLRASSAAPSPVQNRDAFSGSHAAGDLAQATQADALLILFIRRINRMRCGLSTEACMLTREQGPR